MYVKRDKKNHLFWENKEGNGLYYVQWLEIKQVWFIGSKRNVKFDKHTYFGQWLI